jgi:predicted transcriptional regulator
MEKMKVRELMIPIDQFPKISREDAFYDALLTLEESQKKYLMGESEQRILLVQDEDGKVVGKISPIDLLRGLEPNYDEVEVGEDLARFGIGYALKSMRQQYRLWQTPFSDLCRKARDVKIKDFLTKASIEEQSVHVDDSLAKAFDWFVMGRHDSLFVFDGQELVGILRFSDVYKKISITMKECGLKTS